MSLKANKWAWSQPLKASQKLTLLALADRAGDDNICYPSIKRIEVDTGQNRKTIISNMEHLKAAGLIVETGEKVGKTMQVKVYSLELNKQYQKRNSTKNGTVPNLPVNSPKNGTCKQSQKRYLEPTIKEPTIEPIYNATIVDIASATQKEVDKREKFENLWEYYGYKKNKAKAYKMYCKLKESQLQEIRERISSYIANTKIGGYPSRMHLSTYLNPANERWLDEVEELSLEH